MCTYAENTDLSVYAAAASGRYVTVLSHTEMEALKTYSKNFCHSRAFFGHMALVSSNYS